MLTVILGRSVRCSLRHPSSSHSHRIHRLRQHFGPSNRLRWLAISLAQFPARPDGLLARFLDFARPFRWLAGFPCVHGLS